MLRLRAFGFASREKPASYANCMGALTQTLIFAAALTACAGPPLPPLAAPAEPTVSSDGPIVVLGDTQRTLAAEEFFLGREQNEAERRELIAKIANEERPAFVVHLGDMVSVGASGDEWQYFDRLISPLRARRIPIFPVFGNHDLWGARHEAVRLAAQRFPELARGGAYARRHRGLGLIWLNSNLQGDAARRQAEWFERVLRAFDEESATRGVAVFMHHPAYTNGKDRQGQPYVVEQLVPRFLAARKALVLMSGHVHGYERFSKANRAFIVSGGAGGPRVRYRVCGDAAPAAYATDTGARRPFNYVVVEVLHSGLRFTTKCLPERGSCRSGVLERFSLDWPSGR